jgi:hypothetical protein
MSHIARSLIVASLFLSGASAVSAATIPLNAPPISSDPAAETIFDALLAISRASLVDPSRAQHGVAPYNAAVQAYASGNLTGAEQNATAAIVAIDAPAAPPARSNSPVVSPPAPAQYPPLVAVNESESQERLALARRALLSCGSSTATPFTTASGIFQTAVQNELAHHPKAVVQETTMIVNDCAAAIPTATGNTQ